MEAATITPRAPSPEIRAIRRRRPLPGSRAVLGGFLLAVAALGLYLAYAQASATHRISFVVAARNLGPGHRITASDLTTMAMELPPEMARSLAFRQPAELVGSISVAPLSPGELVQVSDVVRAGGAGAPVRLMSMAVPVSRAVNGAISVGDTLDVLATLGTGVQAQTSVVAAGVEVVAISGSSGGFGSAGDRSLIVTLSVPNASEVVALAQASNAGQIVLVRSTGAATRDYAATATQPGASPAPSGAPGAVIPAAPQPGAVP